MNETLLRPWAAIPLMLIGLCLTGTLSAKEIELDLPDPVDFSTTIDNMYLPLAVGTSFAYRGETEDGCEYNKLTVTSDTYMVATGHTTLVIRDQAWEDEDCDGVDAVMVEDTKDYHAQDDADPGNVWYFGEQTYTPLDEEECPTPPCTCDDGGSWEAGLPMGDPEVEPAVPGIVMLGSPEPGDRYQQEFLEDEAEDWAAVTRLNATVAIDYLDSEFEDCLDTKEWSPLEPGEIEHKFYCPTGGGLMLVKEQKGKTLRVEYVGPDFSSLGIGPFPGQDDVAFPSTALDCTP